MTPESCNESWSMITIHNFSRGWKVVGPSVWNQIIISPFLSYEASTIEPHNGTQVNTTEVPSNGEMIHRCFKQHKLLSNTCNILAPLILTEVFLNILVGKSTGWAQILARFVNENPCNVSTLMEWGCQHCDHLAIQSYNTDRRISFTCQSSSQPMDRRASCSVLWASCGRWSLGFMVWRSLPSPFSAFFCSVLAKDSRTHRRS